MLLTAMASLDVLRSVEQPWERCAVGESVMISLLMDGPCRRSAVDILLVWDACNVCHM